ncbi:hypothetical protein [Camelliibacillus cellulosilyticus]|uniref:hypothetical protein n=1 Tax=Camelliibacillus cellulosilyticus TaxID=2174486 RepID=UPI00366D7446
MVYIHFNHIRVEEITRTSGVFTGKNMPVKWRSTSKQNQGFGTISGNQNISSDHIHTVINPNRYKK